MTLITNGEMMLPNSLLYFMPIFVLVSGTAVAAPRISSAAFLSETESQLFMKRRPSVSGAEPVGSTA